MSERWSTLPRPALPVTCTRGAHDQAGPGAPRPRLVAGQLGDAEVEQLDEVLLAPALDQDDVVGLEIAVDDVGLVRRGQRVGDLQRDRQGALGSERRLAADQLGERDPGQELHDEVDEALAAAGPVRPVVDDVDDVRVPDRVDRFRFGEEALGNFGVV
jgi:hypothetical protein